MVVLLNIVYLWCFIYIYIYIYIIYDVSVHGKHPFMVLLFIEMMLLFTISVHNYYVENLLHQIFWQERSIVSPSKVPTLNTLY